jgi:acetyl-CoA synthetase (ADP-forming)
VATRTLSEADSALLVARYGIPTPASRRVPTAELAVTAASELGFPVVVKLNGERIAHKSERGLVRVGLRDHAAVERAATELLAVATPEDGAVDLLVARMVTGARELLAGVTRDAHFGPCVVFGVGGVLAEAFGDAVFRLAPLDPFDAHDMLDELRTQGLLGAFRGEPPVDRRLLVEVLLGLSRLACDEPAVNAVDLNPLVVDDGAPIAVDALVELYT